MTNWSNATLDLNADGLFGGAGEYDDNRTHNVVNELTNRDLDGSGGSGPNYALTYGGNGELATDGHEYEYSWDAWGRLVSVYSIIADAVVSDFEYNGLGWQKSFTEAVAGGGTVTFWNTHDHRGRTLQVRRGSDASGGGAAWFKLRLVYHNAGRAGSGSSLSRNAVVLRDADMTNAWTGASDGALEQRRYSAQNHRGDVVALITDAGHQAEHIRYDAYGYPTALPAGDTDSDGDFDASDSFTGGYDIRKDVDLDGDNDVFDVIAASNINGGYVTLGRGVLSHDTKHHNRIGWQGSEHASATPARLLHTPHRHHHVVLGRWISRDPAGYVDGPSLYQYAISGPIDAWDWSGLACEEGPAGCGCNAGSHALNVLCCQDACDATIGKGQPLATQCCYQQCQQSPQNPSQAISTCVGSNPYVPPVGPKATVPIKPVIAVPRTTPRPAKPKVRPPVRDGLRPPRCTNEGPLSGNPEKCLYTCRCPPGYVTFHNGVPQTVVTAHALCVAPPIMWCTRK